MRKFVCIWMCLMVVLCGLNSGVVAMDMDDLLFGEIPIVITAGRTEQKATETSASVYVITAEDIKRSGVTCIPEVLRMAPGMNVVQVGASEYSVNIRGVCKLPNDMVLVMVDGQKVYSDAQGEIEWTGIPVALEDINRIEIVRGAGSTLYGENAYQGLINIITKKPEEMKGGLIKVTGGENGTYLGTMVYSGVSGKLGYRLSATYDKADQLDAAADIIPVDTPYEISKDLPKGYLLLDYQIGQDSKLSLNAGYSYGTSQWDNIETIVYDERMTYVLVGLTYEQPHLKIMVYDRTLLKPEEDSANYFPDSGVIPGTKVNQNLLCLDAQHSINTGGINSLVWGVTVQKKSNDTTYLVEDVMEQDLWAVYLQDELKLSEKLSTILGLRYDDNSVVGGLFSPRIAAVYSPVENHFIRAAYSRAFRTPTFLELFIEYYVPGDPSYAGMPFPVNLFASDWVYVYGNDELKPMTIDSIEMGYAMPVSENVRANLSIFYDMLENNIEGVGSGLPWDPEIYMNTDKTAQVLGGELVVDFFCNSWLRGSMNYSYSELTESDDVGTSWCGEQIPQHQANLNMIASKDALSANILVHHTGKSEWNKTEIEEGRVVWGYNDTDAYTVVNMRVAYELVEGAEAAVSVFNLLDSGHYEYPAIEIGRKVMGSLSYKF